MEDIANASLMCNSRSSDLDVAVTQYDSDLKDLVKVHAPVKPRSSGCSLFGFLIIFVKLVPRVLSFPSPGARERERDRGKRWSRVSQILGDTWAVFSRVSLSLAPGDGKERTLGTNLHLHELKWQKCQWERKWQLSNLEIKKQVYQQKASE